MNLLFICSRNQWRSPTAEQLFYRHPTHQARSAGTSRNARHTVSAADIAWADHIFVMEEKHQARLKAEFARALQYKPLTVLDIPDDYRYMDAELIELLQTSLQDYL
ncbi:protein tyrosine phosphatase [Wielerella bovis]|uniref:low molecular weight protein tyrosine phosphatase family protein n=1 Tax=Wielerella bovis TaxID=2917790 RepID=UPI00201879F2|nr:protein tyrosine phosphatase [Wielerella bovis]ULJ63494.1 protein tyrosine phosphatase [Wielerella bovis]